MAKAKRLTRKDWLDAAFRTLAREGYRGVRVEVLARDLGVTKGSFYWHFTDRDDLLTSLLHHWHESMTGRVLGEVSDMATPPAARLDALMRFVSKRHYGRHDGAVRQWAQQDKAAARFVRRVDELRFGFVRDLLEEMGFRGADLEMRTRLAVYHLVAEPTIQLREKPSERDAMQRARIALLTKGAKPKR